MSSYGKYPKSFKDILDCLERLLNGINSNENKAIRIKNTMEIVGSRKEYFTILGKQVIHSI